MQAKKILHTVTLAEKGNPIKVNIRESLKASRISIRVADTKKVELIIPVNGDANIAYKFLLTKEDWVRKHLNKLPDINSKPKISNKVYIYGKLHTIIFTEMKNLKEIHIGEGFICISNCISPVDMPILLSNYLKILVKRDLEAFTFETSKMLKVKYNKISVRDTHRQWGSCSRLGNLSFSWRLVFAPRCVMEYLVAHELCHLVERNHGPKFWKLVGKIYPDYIEAKSWLKKNGRTLHHYLLPIK